MNALSIGFAPHLPLWLLAALGVVGLALIVFGALKRATGIFWRFLFIALALLALANPQLLRESRDALDDIVVLATDGSPSQRLAPRPDQTDEAVAGLRERLAAMPGTTLEEVTLEGDERRGSILFDRLERHLAEIDRDRLAGVLTVTDGQIHDVPDDPANLGLGAPFHALITGREGETDRQLVVEEAPSFGMVDEPLEIVVRVDELPESAGEAVPLEVRKDGELVGEHRLQPGADTPLEITLEKAGESVIELEVAELPGELTTLNNRKAITINGIRDRLRVLLVSGQPYPGLRVWRNLLKADPSVDLVHFTILRPPEKQDGTPIRELALIAFPSRELFEVKLEEFDLIIFDRYSRRGLLPLVYLDNVARYVEGGGALLEAAGPEFAEPMGLYRTPLSRVLPGRPSGEVYERGFRPTMTETGSLHPVTGNLADDPEEPGWGRWFRQVDVEAPEAQVLMTGVADRPLLVLERVGEGRVAQLLSDHAWLWQRGFEEGGPQATLLRRLVHWLMREPELEEEALHARAFEDGIVIERQSLESRPREVEVTDPEGDTSTITLEPEEDGVARARIAAEHDGLYSFSDGEHVAYATPRQIAARELSDMRATAERLAPVAAATGGTTHWLEADGVPDLRMVDEGRRTHGRGWLGLERSGAYNVTGVQQTPLLPPWLALTLLLATATIAWWREGRG